MVSTLRLFDEVTLDNGRQAVVPGTYALSEIQIRLSPFDFLVAIPRALAAAQDIIFLVFDYGADVQRFVSLVLG